MNIFNIKTLWAAGLLILVMAGLFSAGSYVPPTEAQSPEHPRLFFSQPELEALRIQAASTHLEIWEPIRDYVDELLGTNPRSNPPRSGGVDEYRHFGNRLIPLALACLIEDTEKYCDLAREHLLAYSRWDQWGENNLRGLGHAHMLFGTSVAYDWLYDYLTPSERAVVAARVGDRAQELYEASAAERYNSDWGNWWRASYLQNHYAIVHSALGIAGLALLDEDERAQNWVDQALSKYRRLQFSLNRIGDGSWHEGIAYQNYTLTMLLPFFTAVQKNLDIDIAPDAYMRSYPYWRMYNYLPGTGENALTHGNFDLSWVNSFNPPGILRYVAARYDSGHAEWVARRLIETVGREVSVDTAPWYVFEFIYYDAGVAPQPPDEMPLSYVFTDMQAVIWRTGWDEDALVFGLYSGSFGGEFASQTFVHGTYPWNPPCRQTGCSLNVGHNHADANNFSLYRGGSWLIHETTGVNQTATSLHNTLLIDGAGQYRPPSSNFGEVVEDFVDRSGRIRTAVSSHGFDYLAAEAVQRYDIDDLTEFTRHVLFVRSGYFIMLDNLSAEMPHRYEWVAHFGAGVSVDDRWVRGDADGEQVVGVGVVAPQLFTHTTGNDGTPYVRIRPGGDVANTRLIHLLYPTDVDSWDSRPAFELLQNDETAAAVRIEPDEGGTDDVLIVYNNPLLDEFTVGDYVFNGQVAFVGRDADGNLERLFVYGGSFLEGAGPDDPVFVANLVASEAFEVTFAGNTAEVWGNLLSLIVLHAPGTDSLTINGLPADFTRVDEYIVFPVIFDDDVALSSPAAVDNPTDEDDPPPDTVPVADDGAAREGPPSRLDGVSECVRVFDNRTLTLWSELLAADGTFSIDVDMCMDANLSPPFLIAGTGTPRGSQLPATDEADSIPFQLLAGVIGIFAAFIGFVRHFRRSQPA